MEDFNIPLSSFARLAPHLELTTCERAMERFHCRVLMTASAGAIVRAHEPQTTGEFGVTLVTTSKFPGVV
jgi:hypothetical protein